MLFYWREGTRLPLVRALLPWTHQPQEVGLGGLGVDDRDSGLGS